MACGRGNHLGPIPSDHHIGLKRDRLLKILSILSDANASTVTMYGLQGEICYVAQGC